MMFDYEIAFNDELHEYILSKSTNDLIEGHFVVYDSSTKHFDDAIPRSLHIDRKYKTELCRSFLQFNQCPYGVKCRFAHGNAELRNVRRHPKYKTKVCIKYDKLGVCPYGNRCMFIHDQK